MKTAAQQNYATTMAVSDIAHELKIGRNKSYDVVRKAYNTGKPFRVVMIDSQYRVVTSSFFGWLHNTASLF